MAVGKKKFHINLWGPSGGVRKGQDSKKGAKGTRKAAKISSPPAVPGKGKGKKP